MAATIDGLTINYEEDGITVIKEIDKQVLSKGAWTTIIFRYQQWEKAKNAYSPDRYSIRLYHKQNGEYRQQTKFNISSRDQAQKIVDALLKWLQ